MVKNGNERDFETNPILVSEIPNIVNNMYAVRGDKEIDVLIKLATGNNNNNIQTLQVLTDLELIFEINARDILANTSENNDIYKKINCVYQYCISQQAIIKFKNKMEIEEEENKLIEELN